MTGTINPDDPFLDLFSDREAELRDFTDVICTKEGEIVHPFGYSGVAGSGKTWLLRKLRDISATEHHLKSYTLTIDPGPEHLGARTPDRVALCSILAHHFEMSAPRTTLAAIFIHAGERSSDFDAKEFTRDILAEGADALTNSFREHFNSFSIGGFVGAGLKAVLQSIAKAREPLAKYLRTEEGKRDLAWLRSQADTVQIRKTLFDRFGLDLYKDQVESRIGFAIQRMLLIDAVDQSFDTSANASERRDAVDWIRELWNACSVAGNGSARQLLLVVPFGQNALEWHANWNDNYETRELGGFLTEDAASYIKNKRGISNQQALDAILKQSLESDHVNRHHVLTLGLLADTFLLDESAVGNILAPSIQRDFQIVDLRPGSEYTAQLVDRFFRRLSDTEKIRIERLAVTRTWDRDAFAYAFNLTEDEDGASVAWKRILAFSFVRKLGDREYAIHDSMRSAALSRLDSSTRNHYRLEWKEYWRKRSKTATDVSARHYWRISYLHDAKLTLYEWHEQVQAMSRQLRRSEESELIDIFRSILVSESTIDATSIEAHLVWASAMVGSFSEYRADSEALAVKIYSYGLSFFNRDTHPIEWARTQFDHGIFLSERRTGDRDDNVRGAIEAYRNALSVYTKREYPQEWAAAQGNLGVILTHQTAGNRSKNIRAGLHAYESALQITKKESDPQGWSLIHRNMSIALRRLADGDRKDNVSEAIDAARMALSVLSPQSDLREWVAAQNNLAAAYLSMPDDVNAWHARSAIGIYESLLQFCSRNDAPFEWAMANYNLGIAFQQYARSGEFEALVSAIECYQHCLEVFTEGHEPAIWARVHNNLARACCELSGGSDSELLSLAEASFQNTLRVYDRNIKWQIFMEDDAEMRRVDVLMNLGSIAKLRGESASAKLLFFDAVQTARRIGYSQAEFDAVAEYEQVAGY